MQVCNDEAAHDQINPNAQEPGGANGALKRSGSSKNHAAHLLYAAHCCAGSGTSCFAGRDGAISDQLAAIGRHIGQVVPSAMFADDQVFRLTSLAFAQPDSEADRRALVAAMRKAGLDVTVNNVWILGWIGAYDKLAMARRAIADAYSINIDADPDAVLYCGDSTNDAPMFTFFRHTVGVSSVRRYLTEIPIPPNWITKGPGGDGFVEVADAVIASKIVG